MQPLAREIGEDILKTDSHRAALVRVNPIRERRSQYEWQVRQLDALLKEKIGEGGEIKEFEVPEFVVGKDVRSIVREEENQYNALKN